MLIFGVYLIRRTRASTDEDPGTLQPSAAAAYLQSISPRDGIEKFMIFF